MRMEGLHIVLCEPEIPPNTGNIIRLCANTGALLNVIKPLGFSMDDARLRRAGLDYHEFAQVLEWDNLECYRDSNQYRRIVAIETSGGILHSDFRFTPKDSLLFGSETKGLSGEILTSLPQENIARLPMLADSRSLNLSNAVAVTVYEAWRQIGYFGGQ